MRDHQDAEPQPAASAQRPGGNPPTAVGSGLWEGDGEGGDIPRERQRYGSEDWRNRPIEDLNLFMRAYNCLRRSGLMTVGQVLGKSEEELLALRNFGRRSYDELRERLDELGIVPLDKDWDEFRGHGGS